jgi:hypothetical protein
VARARSRKRRPTGATRAPAGAGGAASTAGAPEVLDLEAAGAGKKAGKAAASGKARSGKARSSGSKSRSPAAPTYGERPNAPWHPLPLSELLILIGAIAAVLGLVRSGHDSAGGGRLLLAGLAAVAIGTIEVTLREHRSGYRSHTLMLAGLVVLVFDSILVLVLTAITSLPRLFSVGLIALDFALFAFLFKLLRARFLDARHARVIKEG